VKLEGRRMSDVLIFAVGLILGIVVCHLHILGA
jgi:hypothetical protein